MAEKIQDEFISNKFAIVPQGRRTKNNLKIPTGEGRIFISVKGSTLLKNLEKNLNGTNEKRSVVITVLSNPQRLTQMMSRKIKGKLYISAFMTKRLKEGIYNKLKKLSEKYSLDNYSVIISGYYNSLDIEEGNFGEDTMDVLTLKFVKAIVPLSKEKLSFEVVEDLLDSNQIMLENLERDEQDKLIPKKDKKVAKLEELGSSIFYASFVVPKKNTTLKVFKKDDSTFTSLSVLTKNGWINCILKASASFNQLEYYEKLKPNDKIVFVGKIDLTGIDIENETKASMKLKDFSMYKY